MTKDDISYIYLFKFFFFFFSIKLNLSQSLGYPAQISVPYTDISIPIVQSVTYFSHDLDLGQDQGQLSTLSLPQEASGSPSVWALEVKESVSLPVRNLIVYQGRPESPSAKGNVNGIPALHILCSLHSLFFLEGCIRLLPHITPCGYWSVTSASSLWSKRLGAFGIRAFYREHHLWSSEAHGSGHQPEMLLQSALPTNDHMPPPPLCW